MTFRVRAGGAPAPQHARQDTYATPLVRHHARAVAPDRACGSFVSAQCRDSAPQRGRNSVLAWRGLLQVDALGCDLPRARTHADLVSVLWCPSILSAWI